jgi:hypothetical protein
MGRGVFEAYRVVWNADQVAPFAGLARGDFLRGVKRLIKMFIARWRKWVLGRGGESTQVGQDRASFGPSPQPSARKYTRREREDEDRASGKGVCSVHSGSTVWRGLRAHLANLETKGAGRTCRSYGQFGLSLRLETEFGAFRIDGRAPRSAYPQGGGDACFWSGSGNCSGGASRRRQYVSPGSGAATCQPGGTRTAGGAAGSFDGCRGAAAGDGGGSTAASAGRLSHRPEYWSHQFAKCT